MLLGEVFNVLNVANLTGHSGNLVQTSAFGQPTNRVTQLFGSGGPRAFQVGEFRVSPNICYETVMPHVIYLHSALTQNRIITTM